MFEAIRRLLLRALCVPSEPAPPAGAPGTLRVFHAGRNYYRLRLARWAVGQLGAAVGIIVSLVMLDRFEVGVEAQRAAAIRRAQAEVTAAARPETGDATKAAPAEESPAPRKKSRNQARADRAQAAMQRVATHWPSWVFPLLKLIEAGAVLGYLVQLPFTYLMVRLDYELRWYMVTDRSLRIHAGLVALSESTMSFANLQQVVVTQGPIQRLLGLADVRVQSAGGGGGLERHESGDTMHTGFFHGVDNAEEIRDLILDRLRRFRETGLGDPDERRAAPVADGAAPSPVLAAAQTLRDEARALRRVSG